MLVAKNYFKHERPDWNPMLARLGILRQVRMQVEPGVNLNPDPLDLISTEILKHRIWQSNVWNSLSASLDEGAVLLDVGAHIGYFTLKGAAKIGPKGRVVSFEPNPETLAELRGNVAASHAESIVIVEPIACSDRDRELTLYAARVWNTGGSSLSEQNTRGFDDVPKAYPVRGRPIDDVVRELGLTRVDAVKIDVEGAEVSVLRGAIETLKRFHPKVVIEMDEHQLAGFGTKPQDLIDLFKTTGYNHGTSLGGEDWEWLGLGQENTFEAVRTANVAQAAQLISGFYGIEGDWRWAAKEFTIALKIPKKPHP